MSIDLLKARLKPFGTPPDLSQEAIDGELRRYLGTVLDGRIVSAYNVHLSTTIPDWAKKVWLHPGNALEFSYRVNWAEVPIDEKGQYDAAFSAES